MAIQKGEMTNPRRCWLLFLPLTCLSFFFWRFTMKGSPCPPEVTLSCRPHFHSSAVTNISAGHHPVVSLQKLPSEIYDQPDSNKASRTDVLLLSPWLAPIVWSGTYNAAILNAHFHQSDVRVGITVFAIKKYTVFVKQFIQTAEKYFMKGHKVTYYVFTDRAGDIPTLTLAEGRRMIVLVVPTYERWQEVSMRRMQMIRDFSRERFQDEVDYLVCVDVDMIFTDEIGVEILSDLIGTLHPGQHRLPREEATFERNPKSEAYIPTNEGDFYYAGGFFGGTVEEVYKLTNFCHNAMLADKSKTIEAVWHDESYLNKYFLYNKPTKILSPEYLWDNDFGSPEFLRRRRFVAVRKDHEKMRTRR